MENEKKSLSLGKKVALSCFSLILLFFALSLFFMINIFSPMFIKMEIDFMEEQIAVFNNAFDDFVDNTTKVAQSSGLQENISNVFSLSSPFNLTLSQDVMEIYSLNYVVILNDAGDEIYSENNFVSQEENTEFSEEFMHYLSQMTSEFKIRQGLNEKGEYVSVASIVNLSDVSYAFVIMPVFDGMAFVGTITYGSILNEAFFEKLMRNNDMIYEISTFEQNQEPVSYVKANDKDVFGVVALHDSRGETLKLTIQRNELQNRYIHDFQFTFLVFILTSLFLVAVTICFIYKKYIISDIKKIVGALKNGEKINLNESSSSELLYISNVFNSLKSELLMSEKSQDDNKVYRDILDNVDAKIFIHDANTNEILYINKTLSDELGMTFSQLVGDTCDNVFNKNPLNPYSQWALNTLENSASEFGDNIVCCEDDYYFLTTRKPIKWNTNTQAYIQMGSDVSKTIKNKTEIKQRLKEQELMSKLTAAFISNKGTSELLQSFLQYIAECLDLSKAAILKLTLDKSEIESLEIWSNPKEALKETVFEDIPFDENNIFYRDFLINKKPYIICTDVENSSDLTFLKDTGILSIFSLPIIVQDDVWGIISLESWRENRKWKDDDIHLMTVVITLISSLIEKEYMEEKLKVMSGIVNNSPQIMAYIRFGGEIAFTNTAAEVVTGYTKEELINMSSHKLFTEETLKMMMLDHIPRTRAGENLQLEVPIITKSGAILDMLISIFATPNHHDPGFGLVGVDITEKNKMENELILAKEEAIASSLAKSTFLSRMSHEMRTPMNAIIGMTSIAIMAEELDRKNYCLNKIDLASKHLLGVINDILDMSKIEANKFELSYTDFTLEKMLIKVTNVINFRVDEKKQDLIVRVDSDVPVAIVSDEQHLNQVITNLLSNAVKFTPEEGKITLDVAVLEEVNGIYTLRFEVKDTGIGVTPEQKSRLFNSFEQADGSISRKFGGTGLGLAISKTIVELMEGEIWIESDYGHGSSFIFTIKAAIGQDAEVSALNPDVNWDNMKILVVDDSVEVREYFEAFAQAIELDLMIVEDGYSALDLIDSTDGIFIVFVDWKMPKMDGIELATKIKEKYGDSIIIIMISGVEWDTIEEDAKKAGVQKFIQKPLFASNITDCLNECLGSRTNKDDTFNLEDEVVSFKGHSILLAEDVEVNREIVVSLLEDTEIEIDCAENGLEAVRMFKENPNKYDIIFMDIHMPEMGGFEATEAIRKMKVDRVVEIPIVAMTANVFREDIDECLAAGMDDHVGKPIDIDDVIEKIKRYIRY